MASNCANCKWRASAEKEPGKFTSKLWRWHTKWCPGWRAYQKELASKK